MNIKESLENYQKTHYILSRKSRGLDQQSREKTAILARQIAAIFVDPVEITIFGSTSVQCWAGDFPSICLKGYGVRIGFDPGYSQVRSRATSGRMSCQQRVWRQGACGRCRAHVWRAEGGACTSSKFRECLLRNAFLPSLPLVFLHARLRSMAVGEFHQQYCYL